MKAQTESGKTITIDDRYEIKRGGEGKILTVPELPQQVAKIYLNSNYQHMSKAQKDALACLDTQLFVKPLELIYEKKNKDIIGFTMEYISPEFVPLAAFYNKNYGASVGISDTFKFKVAEKILAGVEHAHTHNIIIGDLSGLNILVNTQEDVKFIDTDSYETAVHTHWGVLLDEIRDYLYQGQVSKQSDYFAVAVILFNLFTNMHPFKGVHKTIKSMAERMLKKRPVFAQDPDLILPKCYEPIQNTALQSQFEELFLEGKRFLLQLTPTLPTQTTPTPSPLQSLHLSTPLKYKEIYKLQAGEVFRKTYFTQQLGYVQTNYQTFLYDASNQGYLTLKATFTHDSETRYFVGNKHLLRQQKWALEVWQGGQNWLKLQNVQLSESARLHQIQDILVVLDHDFMRLLHIDDVIQDQIHIDQTPAFIAGFDALYSLVQNVGGVQFVWYHSGKTLSTVKTASPIKNALIAGNVGLAIHETTLNGETTLTYEYFTLQSLQMKMTGERVHELRNFAVKGTQNQTNLIFEPADDKIVVRKGDTAQILQEIACSLITTATSLQLAQAGIIAYEKDFCYLLNT
jgi:serine/threonine protein kinase